MFADESFRIIAFVCAPLLILLIAALVLRIRSTPRTSVTFTTFSVSLATVGHETAYVTYNEGHTKIHFDAEIGRSEKFFVPRIYLRVPREMPDEDVHRIVPNLILGFTSLGYPYVIYKPGELQVIPQPERDRAVAELHRMGTEVDTSKDRVQIKKTSLPYWRRVVGVQARTTVPVWLRLLNKTRGVHENVEVLARSD